MLKYRKKEILIIIFILSFALVATYYIYYKFKDSRDLKYDSDTLDVIYHEKSGDKVDITKITPVTDSVGLSSKTYSFTIKNNTNTSLRYSISILDDMDEVISDQCEDKQIPKNLIRLSIHGEGEQNNIYTLSDLVNGKVLSRIIKANQEKEYTMKMAKIPVGWLQEANTNLLMENLC